MSSSGWREEKASIQMPRESDILNDNLYSTQNELKEDEINNYICHFITNLQSGRELGYQNSVDVYKRIQAIPQLAEIVRDPLLLKMTMHCLPLLEVFYQQEENRSSDLLVIKKDIFHFFTSLVISDMTTKVGLETPDEAHDKNKVSDALLKYNCAVSNMMLKSNLSEVKEEALLTRPELSTYKKFFQAKYSSSTFPSMNAFTILNLSRMNAFFCNLRRKREVIVFYILISSIISLHCFQNLYEAED